MRRYKKLLIWTVVSLGFQILLLVFLDEFYLSRRSSNVEIVKYAEIGASKTSGQVSIPEGAIQVGISYDASYVSYMFDEKLYIIDTGSGDTAAEWGGGFPANFYKWLPDRNMLIFSNEETKNNMGTISIRTYDADAGLVRSYPEITALPAGSHVEDIQLSTLTNLVYVKIVTGTNSAEIYRFNIMEEQDHVMTVDSDVEILLLHISDVLLYQQDGAGIKLRYDSSGEEKELDARGSLLLGSDTEDVVYLGERDEKGNVTGIKYGTLNQIHEQKHFYVELRKSYPVEQVVVTYNGGIYIIEKEKKTVLDIKHKTEIKYKGEYAGIFSNYLLTTDGSILYFDTVYRD